MKFLSIILNVFELITQIRLADDALQYLNLHTSITTRALSFPDEDGVIAPCLSMSFKCLKSLKSNKISHTYTHTHKRGRRRLRQGFRDGVRWGPRRVAEGVSLAVTNSYSPDLGDAD